MAKKTKKTSLPRCVCGAYGSAVYLPSRRADGQPVWVSGSCRKCERLAVDAKMVEGGCLKFIDDMEVEFQVYEASAEEAEAAVFVDRCRRIDVDGEIYLCAIFKVEYEHGFEWYAQPIPWEAEG
jgi:hypothetical protein